MKRLFAVVLAIAIVLSLSVSSFAWNTTEIIFDDYVGGKINDAGVGFSFRTDFTPGRVPTGGTTWNEASIVEYNEDDGYAYAKMVAPQYVITEYDSHLPMYSTLSFEIRKGDVNGFAGLVYAYNTADKLGHTENTETTHKSDYFITNYSAASDDGKATYAMATGVGFTFLKDSNEIVRVFVRCFNEAGELDVIYYDFDTGYDLSSEFNYYAFSYEDGNIVFSINEKVVATIEFSGSAEKVTETIDDKALKGKYIRTAKLVDGFGKEIASTTKALITDAEEFDEALSLTGEGTTYDVLSISYADDVTPTSPFYKKGTEPTPVPATPKPEVTEAPATDAPATEAPETDAPAAAGCGSIIASSAAVIALAGAVIFMKKKD